MARDPAFLFYSDNFQSGTQFLTNEQVGKYIRVICALHLHGHLTEKQVLMICGTHDEEVFSKLRIDTDGKYYNERLEIEVVKRKAFTESRRNNRLGKKYGEKLNNTSLSCVIHMGDGNENGNKYLIKIGNTTYVARPSDVLRSPEFQQRFESTLMTSLAGIDETKLLAEFDKEFASHEFETRNHFFATLKIFGKKILNPPKGKYEKEAVKKIDDNFKVK